MNAARLYSVQVGRIAPLGPQGVPSAIIKSRIDVPVAVTSLGLAGDEQADLSVHGGPEKAVYGYAAAHYPAWIADHPEHAALFVAGGVGENLTIDGWVERDLCVGDVHRIGTARLQVCQPRQPCSKFVLRFADSKLAKAMVRNGRAGWYYRVIEEGALSAGDVVELVDRPNPDFAFDRLVDIVNRRRATAHEFAAMSRMEGIASDIRQWAQSQ